MRQRSSRTPSLLLHLHPRSTAGTRSPPQEGRGEAAPDGTVKTSAEADPGVATAEERREAADLPKLKVCVRRRHAPAE